MHHSYLGLVGGASLYCTCRLATLRYGHTTVSPTQLLMPCTVLLAGFIVVPLYVPNSVSTWLSNLEKDLADKVLSIGCTASELLCSQYPHIMICMSTRVHRQQNMQDDNQLMDGHIDIAAQCCAEYPVGVY